MSTKQCITKHYFPGNPILYLLHFMLVDHGGLGPLVFHVSGLTECCCTACKKHNSVYQLKWFTDQSPTRCWSQANSCWSERLQCRFLYCIFVTLSQKMMNALNAPKCRQNLIFKASEEHLCRVVPGRNAQDLLIIFGLPFTVCWLKFTPFQSEQVAAMWTFAAPNLLLKFFIVLRSTKDPVKILTFLIALRNRTHWLTRWAHVKVLLFYYLVGSNV